jgi:hypothetical protein
VGSFLPPGKILQLFTATKSQSYVALLYIKGEEREALNIEGNSRAEPQEFIELAAINTAIECFKVSAGAGVKSNLSGPFERLELFVENYQLYLLLTGRREGSTNLSGRALRTFAKFQDVTEDIGESLRLRLMDSCGVCECILHRAIENVYDRTQRADFEEHMLNTIAPPGVLLPSYAHQSTGPTRLSNKVLLRGGAHIVQVRGDSEQDGSR